LEEKYLEEKYLEVTPIEHLLSPSLENKLTLRRRARRKGI